MGIQSISATMEKYVMPVADKMGNECHLRAIRDAFMSLLPITFIGGIAAVISSAPSVETAGGGLTLGWAKFVANNSTIFSWINALTLGAMSFYICIGIIHFLCKSRKVESFIPILLGVFGFMMLIMEPISLGWDGKTAEISFMDGKGLVAAMVISIATADLYCYMRKRELGKINLPDTVPASLSDIFASIVPGAILMGLYILIFAAMNKLGTTLPKLIYHAISPSLTAVDNLGFTIIITMLVQIF
ncbi:MAG: PTS transporter subunit EIIC, partial [Lacrimispora sp.]